MAAYRQVHDSHHPQADWQEPGSAPDGTLHSAIVHVQKNTKKQRAATATDPFVLLVGGHGLLV